MEITNDIPILSNDGKMLLGTKHPSTATNIVIPDSVTHIGFMAFYGCTSLQRVNISNNVKNIGCYAFGDCKSLENISIHVKDIEEITIDNDCFDGIDFEKCTLYIPIGSILAYRNHPAFGNFKNIDVL